MERNTIRKKILGIILLFVICLAAVYIAFLLYFKNHFYFNTSINGIDYSCKSAAQAEEMTSEIAREYVLTVTGRQKQKNTITAKEINLSYRPEGVFEEIIEQQPPHLWLASLFVKQDYEVLIPVNYKENALKDKIKQLIFWEPKYTKAPKDAYISEYSQEEQKFSIVSQEQGTKLKKNETFEKITMAIQTLEDNLDLDTEKCYEEPAVKQDNKNLLHTLSILNKYVSAAITYELIEGRDVVEADKIQEWIFIKDGKIGLDEEAIRLYINSIAKEYDTYGKRRTFHTTDGRDIELPSGGFGWKIDRAMETEALIEHIQNGETLTKEPLYSVEGGTKKKDDIGDTYVEIDLGNQHLYLYEEGNIILESDFVSGNMLRGWGTPAGVFGLTYKERNSVLRGENYRTPVNYWMPFNGNVGMHDSTWRRDFGKDIYVANGSHGCVNLPLSAAEKIYEFVYKGIPVICYYE